MLGGQGFVGLPNRYQDFCDLSGLLDLGRAIVVARGDRPGSQLVDKNSGQPLAASDEAADGRVSCDHSGRGIPHPQLSTLSPQSFPMIELRDLTKKYGELFAINSIDLKLDEGDVFGFIGPNGAGKTTTMRILATLLNPTWGEAYVCGYSIYTKPKEIRRMIGYMPDFFGVYDDMKVIEYLEFFAAAYRIRGPKRAASLRTVLELVDLGYKRDALRHEPVARHDAAAGPGARAAARSAGAAARRAGQRPRSAGPHRDSRAAQGAAARWARRSWSPATSCPSWPTSATRSASSSGAS